MVKVTIVPLTARVSVAATPERSEPANLAQVVGLDTVVRQLRTLGLPNRHLMAALLRTMASSLPTRSPSSTALEARQALATATSHAAILQALTLIVASKHTLIHGGRPTASLAHQRIPDTISPTSPKSPTATAISMALEATSRTVANDLVVDTSLTVANSLAVVTRTIPIARLHLRTISRTHMVAMVTLGRIPISPATATANPATATPSPVTDTVSMEATLSPAMVAIKEAINSRVTAMAKATMRSLQTLLTLASSVMAREWTVF